MDEHRETMIRIIWMGTERDEMEMGIEDEIKRLQPRVKGESWAYNAYIVIYSGMASIVVDSPDSHKLAQCPGVHSHPA